MHKNNNEEIIINNLGMYGCKVLELLSLFLSFLFIILLVTLSLANFLSPLFPLLSESFSSFEEK